MKICHLTSVHSYNDTRIFVKECSTLAQSGYEVYLIAPNVNDKMENDVQILGIEKTNGGRFKRMTRTVKAVYEKAIEINADIYHFHDPELIPIGLKLKKKGKKVIYDVHEDVPRQILTKSWIPKFARNLVSKSVEKYENYASRNFDAIITATPYIRERFLKVNSNTVDINNYPLLKELKIEGISWSEKENSICYLGGISFIRGIKEMTMALEMTKDITLLLGGEFSISSEREVVMNLDGWKNVNELGFLNREGVKDTYRRSKAGMVTLQPTINYVDALPVKMFEYMAAGIPVIASNFPLWKGIIEKNECGLCVDPLSPMKIADAINYVITNPEIAEKMGRNGRIAVETEYNWEQESKKLIEKYENL